MKWIFILALAVAVLGLETDHFVLVNSSDSTLASYLEEAYRYYKDKGLNPLPPCSGAKYPVYIDNDAPYPAYAEIGGSCINRIVVKTYTKRLIFHEVAHIFYERYDSDTRHYYWADEAVVEAMASVATGVYYYPSLFFYESLYRVDPFSLKRDRLVDWYKYSAAVVWYLEREPWEWVLKTFSSPAGAADLYVRYLIKIATGVEMGGVRYQPQYERVYVLGLRRFELRLEGYTASYFELKLEPPGFLTISIDSPSVVSNVLLNKEFYIDNSTVYLALVNNSTDVLNVRVEIRYSRFQLKIIGGEYDGDYIYLDLYAVYRGLEVSGEVKINGSSVEFKNGVGRFRLGRDLRRYLLVAEYDGYVTNIYIDINFNLSTSPKLLYLGEGGRGFINVTIQNPSPISIRCLLNGSAAGVAFSPVRVEAPPNSSTAARLEFRVVGDVGDNIYVYCGGLRDVIKVRKPSYILTYDLDNERGRLEVWFGNSLVSYEVTRLPADISINYGGYVAAVVKIQEPQFEIQPSAPRLRGGGVVYTLSLKSKAPPWVLFTGAVSIDGSVVGRYTGGVFNFTISLKPGEARVLKVGVGRYVFDYWISAPRVESWVEPLAAVVENDRVKLLVLIKHSVELEGEAFIKFEGASASPITDRLVVLEYKYSDVIYINYEAWGERKSTTVAIPRPQIDVSLVRGVVSPDVFTGVFNTTISVCNPSVRTKYSLRVVDKTLVLDAAPGECVKNFTIVNITVPYRPHIEVTIDAVLSTKSISLEVPPPLVKVVRYLWVVDNGEEWVNITLFVNATGYIYRIFNREFRGVDYLDISTRPLNGSVVIDYGFGVEVLQRPSLNISIQPTVVEVGYSKPLRVVISTPSVLYIRDVVKTQWGSVPVEVKNGTTVQVEIPTPRDPGVYNIDIHLGPYRGVAEVVRYLVNLTATAPRLVPVTYVVDVVVNGSVTPPVANPSAVVETVGCINSTGVVPIGSVFRVSSNRTCELTIRAYTNSSVAVIKVKWASLDIVFEYQALGYVNGIPVIAPRSLRARSTLGGEDVDGFVKIYGDFDRLGLVNFTAVVEYMGVVNKSSLLAVVAPVENFKAAVSAAAEMPHESNSFFMYLVEKAALSGDWGPVDKISQLYKSLPTPFTLIARRLVERDLAMERMPDLKAIDILLKLEPLIYGVIIGVALARRFV